MPAVKVVKVMGTSGESWQHAAEEAFREASMTIDNISGIEIEDFTADVQGGDIQEYRATIEVAFPVEDRQR